MTIGSTSRTSLAYMPETAFGVTPNTGNPSALRILDESFDYQISKTLSNEINTFRSVSAMIPVTAKAVGGFGGEMQYAEYDRILASTMQNAWGAYGTNGVGSTFTAAIGLTTITATVAPTGTSAFTNLKPGQWFRFISAGDVNNGTLFRVSKAVAPTGTVITLDANTPGVVSANAASASLQSSRLTNGTSQSSFTFEVVANDVGDWRAFKGMTPSKFDLTINASAISIAKFEFMGAGIAHSTTATNLPGTLAASNTYSPQSGVSTSSAQVYENGIPLTNVKSIAFTYDNALREQNAVGSLSPVGVGSGNIVCDVTAEIFFSGGTLYDRFLANVNTEFMFASLDGMGNGYVFTLPNAAIKSATIVAGGKDQDLLAKVVFSGLRDAGNANAALQQLIFIDRVGAAVAP